MAQKAFAAGPSRDFKIQRREIDVAGDSAYELTWFSETTKRHHMQGRHFILWKRGPDSVWRVHRYHLQLFRRRADLVTLTPRSTRVRALEGIQH